MWSTARAWHPSVPSLGCPSELSSKSRNFIVPDNLYGTHSCIRRWFHLTCNRKYIHRWNNLYCIDIHTCTLGRKTSLTHHIGIFNTLLSHCRFLYAPFYIISFALTFYLVFIKSYRKLVKTSKLKNHVYFGICYKEMFFRFFLNYFCLAQ